MKVSTVILSYLSDAEALIGFKSSTAAKENIEFAKYLILQYPNTDVEVTTEELNNHFENYRK